MLAVGATAGVAVRSVYLPDVSTGQYTDLTATPTLDCCQVRLP